jgi:hypothetical protein
VCVGGGGLQDESSKAETDAKNLTMGRSNKLDTFAIGVRGKTIDERREHKTERDELDSD